MAHPTTYDPSPEVVSWSNWLIRFHEFSPAPSNSALTAEQVNSWRIQTNRILSWDPALAKELIWNSWEPNRLTWKSELEHILGSLERTNLLSGIIPLKIKTGEINVLNTHKSEMDAHAEFLYASIVSFSENNRANIDTCRQIFIRSSVTTFLNNYVEYLAMSGDFEEAQIWYEKALFVAKILHARQAYYDLLVYMVARFSHADTGMGLSLTEYAVFISQYAQDADIWFYNDITGLSDQHRAQKSSRSARNHAQANLVGIFAYFQDTSLTESSYVEFQTRVQEFEAVKQMFTKIFGQKSGALTQYEMGDAVLFHKIENRIAQRVHDYSSQQSAQNLQSNMSILGKYTSSSFWLPDIEVAHMVAKKRAIALWCTWRRNATVDLRAPLIQALSNSIVYSQWQHSLQPVANQRKLVYSIARSMIHNFSHIESDIRQYLEVQKNNPDVQQFIISLRIMNSERDPNLDVKKDWAPPFDPVSYLTSIFFSNNAYPCVLLDSIFPHQNWTVQYPIPGTHLSVRIYGKDADHPNLQAIIRRWSWLDIGWGITLIWKPSSGYEQYLSVESRELLERHFTLQLQAILWKFKADMIEKKAILQHTIKSIWIYMDIFRNEKEINKPLVEACGVFSLLLRSHFQFFQGWSTPENPNPSNVIHNMLEYQILFKSINIQLSSIILSLESLILFGSWPSAMQDAISAYISNGTALIREIEQFLSWSQK